MHINYCKEERTGKCEHEDVSDTDAENKLNAFVTALLHAAHWGREQAGEGGKGWSLHTGVPCPCAEQQPLFPGLHIGSCSRVLAHRVLGRERVVFSHGNTRVQARPPTTSTYPSGYPSMDRPTTPPRLFCIHVSPKSCLGAPPKLEGQQLRQMGCLTLSCGLTHHEPHPEPACPYIRNTKVRWQV